MPEVPRYQINQIKRNTYKCKTKSLCSGKNNNKKSKHSSQLNRENVLLDGDKRKYIINLQNEESQTILAEPLERISGVQHNDLARYVASLILKVIGIGVQELLNLFSQKSPTLQGSKKAFFTTC